MSINVRKAVEADRLNIALCIAKAFHKEFSELSKDSFVIAKAIKDGLLIEKFFVAHTGEIIAGTLAVTDSSQRATDVNLMKLLENLGPIRGPNSFLKVLLSKPILKAEFESTLDYPKTTGYIEFVSVNEEFRGQRIASFMLQEAINLTNYDEYALDVTDVNNVALKIYKKFGFQELKRVPVKMFKKQKGFNAKIYMIYKHGTKKGA